MKKFLYLFLVSLFLVAPVRATDITIISTTVPYANITDLGASRTGTASVVNGNSAITLGTALPSNYVGLTGFQIKLGSAIYYVTSVDSTTQITLQGIYTASTGSVSFEIYPFVLLRVFASKNFIPLGAGYVVQSGNSTTGTGFFKQIAATYRLGQLYLPDIVLQATTDLAETADRDVRYTIWFYRLNGSQIRVYDGFQSFRMPHGSSSTTWPAIKAYNTPSATITPNFNAYNTDQTNALLDTIVTATPDYILKSSTTGKRAEDSGIYQSGTEIVNTLDMTVEGVTDQAGGVPVKTASQIAALSSGNKGRRFYQSDGIKGIYEDFGSSVGIRRVNPCVTGYEIGLVPNSSGSASSNSTAYSAFHSNAPNNGACLQLDEATYYFSSTLANTKPIQIIGAGSNFANGSQVAGTTLSFPTNTTGISFTGALSAKGGKVANLNIVTASRGTSGDGIYTNAPITVENVSIDDVGRYGLHFDGSGLGNTDFSRVDTVHITDTTSDGVFTTGEANRMFLANVNVTRAGRHGVNDNGWVNTWVNTHVAFSGQISGTGSSHDYRANGNSTIWQGVYSESGTGTERFYLDSSASYNDVVGGQFGQPTVTYLNTTVAAQGHRIWVAGRQNELGLRDKFADGSGHNYTLAAGNYDATGGLIINDDTSSTRVLSYNPTTTTVALPGINIRQLSATNVTPSQITSNQNNYNPSAGTVYRLSSDASRNITGWTAPTLDGTELEIRNIGSYDIVFKHQSSSSTAANRFINEIGLDVAIGTNQGVKLRYDSTTARWRVSLLQ